MGIVVASNLPELGLLTGEKGFSHRMSENQLGN